MNKALLFPLSALALALSCEAIANDDEVDRAFVELFDDNDDDEDAPGLINGPGRDDDDTVNDDRGAPIEVGDDTNDEDGTLVDALDDVDEGEERTLGALLDLPFLGDPAGLDLDDLLGGGGSPLAGVGGLGL